MKFLYKFQITKRERQTDISTLYSIDTSSKEEQYRYSMVHFQHSNFLLTVLHYFAGCKEDVIFGCCVGACSSKFCFLLWRLLLTVAETSEVEFLESAIVI